MDAMRVAVSTVRFAKETCPFKTRLNVLGFTLCLRAILDCLMCPSLYLRYTVALADLSIIILRSSKIIALALKQRTWYKKTKRGVEDKTMAKQNQKRELLRKEAKKYATLVHRAYKLKEIDDPLLAKKELAEEIGAHASSISRMLRGEAGWSIERYIAALKFLEIDPHDVICKQRVEGGEDRTMAQILSLVPRLRDKDTAIAILDKIANMEKSDPLAAEKILNAAIAIEAAGMSKKVAAAPRRKRA